MTLRVLPLLLLWPSLACAIDPPNAELEQQMKAVAVKHQKSVALVIVSHADYPNQTEKDTAEGRLGEFVSRGSSDPKDRDPLDLSLAVNTSRYQLANGVAVADQLILVPNHVIDGAKKIYVRTSELDGSYANIYAADTRSDLAILELIRPIKELTPISLSKKTRLQPSDITIALSRTMKENFRFDLGVVSEINRKIEIPIETTFGGLTQSAPFVSFKTLALSTAPTARHLSGSAIVNTQGELIGISTALGAIAGSDQASGTIMPVDNLYRPIIETLMKGREVEYGFLGISYMPAGGFGGMRGRGGFRGQGFNPFAQPEVQDDGDGVFIDQVTQDMPAAKAGLRPGDQITAINGFPITNRAEMQFRIAAALAEHPTSIVVRRDGQLLPPKIVSLVKSKNPMPWIASQKPKPVFGITVDHWSTLMQDVMQNDQRNQTSRLKVPQGVVIASIEPDSPAASKLNELNRRYVISQCNGREMRSPRDFELVTKDAKSISIIVERVADPSQRKFEISLP